MQFERTRIDGVVLIRLDVKKDGRGAFARTFCTNEMAAAGLRFVVVQTNISRNIARHTLRGLHYQRAPHGEPKIVSCPRGRIWDVAVDLREDSPTYRQWQAFELSQDSDSAVHLPAGVAHGFITLEADSEVHYLMGAAYVPGAATGVRWDDPAIGIDWPAAPAVMSDADQGYPLLL
ncbi:dTDP-4-dehydrorhamnose 3,5-epimerase family protein [Sphingomonas albertensis]|uniref:dTDP-4-dehydrorhamnose 3,5-epimerase n=1 Tax=Sphingomonas albertensis TaxID=2762591 RepID=A0ABR7ALH4_9SPHN|nr:dTDP-4-dehydrorhamnose 3,5-epimerase family protein [Sphingomonas albertensis]MBC3941310.1 dTDP-4-dehydrorhamnose 3,5-epimerase family protein [Sphingomonas albertensis]